MSVASTAKDWFEVFEVIERNFYKTSGIVLVWMLAWAASWQAGITPTSIVGATIYLVEIALLYGGWTFIRRVPQFGPNEIGILIEPTGDESVKGELEALKRELKAELKKSVLSKRISIKQLPPNRIVEDVDAAVRIRTKSRCHLFIWGRYERGRMGGKTFQGFRDNQLNFTYAVPRPEFVSAFGADVGQSIANRSWLVSSENELVDRKFLVGNLANVAKYIIASYLLGVGNLAASKVFFIEALQAPAKWTGRSEKIVYAFVQGIKRKLARIEWMEANAIYSQKVLVNGKFNRDPATLELIIGLTETSLSNGPTPEAYLVRAIVFFLKNDMVKSRRALKNFKARWPHQAACLYSEAFLDAFEGDLESAERCYRRAFKMTVNADPQFVFHLAEFLDAAIFEFPNNPGLRLALGLIHMELLDDALAIPQFEAFVNMIGGGASSIWGQKVMAKISEIRIRNLKSDRLAIAA